MQIVKLLGKVCKNEAPAIKKAYKSISKTANAPKPELPAFLSCDLFQSKTIRELFRPQNIPKERLNDNFYITTVLKKNNTPTEVFFKESESPIPNLQEWKFYDMLASNQYREIGNIAISKDPIRRSLNIESMNSYYNDLYSGLGIREHQLASELLRYENCDFLSLSSKPDAFPFHYKLGYRMESCWKKLTKSSFDKLLANIQSQLNLSLNRLKELLCFSEKENFVIFDELSYENIYRFLMSKGNQTLKIDKNFSMKLSKENLQLFEKLSELQPMII
ncbi:MAG: hypothetical protein MJ237_00915 [bacterium]|nr:hypothetical protein [bacterium]